MTYKIREAFTDNSETVESDGSIHFGENVEVCWVKMEDELVKITVGHPFEIRSILGVLTVYKV